MTRLSFKASEGAFDVKSIALDLKAVSQEGEFEGYAAAFGNVDSSGDVIVRGAFAKSIETKGPGGIKLLVDHDTTKRVGFLTAVSEDARGLKVKGQIVVEKQIGAETLIDLRSGMLDAMSIGYRTLKDRTDDKTGARYLEQIDLYEVSFVPFPANPKARVTAVKSDIIEFRDRLAAGERLTEREWEALLKSDAPLRLTNAQAERAVRVNLKSGRGDLGDRNTAAEFARLVLAGR